MKTVPILSPAELKKKISLSLETHTFIQNSKKKIKDVFLRKDKRLVFILGPCSIHDTNSILDYANKFKHLSNQVEKNFVFVLRFFIEKSRTHLGWKGFIYDPFLDNSHQIQEGIILARQLLIQLAERGICCSMEFVDPILAKYFDDLIVWGFIGARTASSQYHRQYASSLDIPVGFKNALDGNLDVAIYGILSSQTPHSFLYIHDKGTLCQIQTEGNPYSHIVLRGADTHINCDAFSINQALQRLQYFNLPKRVMVDCSHGNSQKNPLKQIENFENCIFQIQEGNESIFGLMLESFLEYGNQKTPSKYGVSITDGCLDWKTTEKLILKANVLLSNFFSHAL